MKQATVVLVLFGILMTGSFGAWAASGNPFGFETDTHPLKYEYCKRDRDRKSSYLRGHGYVCSSAPRPHPDFHDYVLEFVEDVGLCRIFVNSNYFLWDKEFLKFEIVKGQVTKKYGPYTSKSGTDYKRVYHWSVDEGFEGVGDVTALRLSAYKEGNALAFIMTFGLRTSQCKKAIDDKADRAF